MVYLPQVLGQQLRMNICVVIPTYNEANAIGNVINQVRARNLDLLIIDDGSTDNTYEIAQSSGVKVLKNLKNQGKGAALIRGFEFALNNNYDAVITMDGDGQHLADDIPLFIGACENSKSAIIVGNRMKETKSMPLIRILTNKSMSWLISLVAGQIIPDTQCGFRLIKKEVLTKTRFRSNNFEIESEILIKASRAGFKIDSIPIKTVYGKEKSRINPILDSLRFIVFILKELWTT